MSDKRYLGDGLYAEWDGWHVVLTAPRMEGDHVVYLDQDTWEALVDYVGFLKKKKAADDAK